MKTLIQSIFMSMLFFGSTVSAFAGLIVDPGGPYTVNVGDSLTVTATAQDTTNPDPLTYAWDINRNGCWGCFPGDAVDIYASSFTLSWADILNFYGRTLDNGVGDVNINLQVTTSTGFQKYATARISFVQPSPPSTSVSEPQTLALLGLGIMGLAASRRKK